MNGAKSTEILTFFFHSTHLNERTESENADLSIMQTQKAVRVVDPLLYKGVHPTHDDTLGEAEVMIERCDDDLL